MLKIPLDIQNIKFNAPCESGIYFLFDEQQQVAYIGKSVDIRRRLLEHFHGHSHLNDHENYCYFTYSLCSEHVLEEVESIMVSNIIPVDNVKKKSNLTDQVGFYLEPEVARTLSALSKATRLSKSRIANDLLKETLIKGDFMDEEGNILIEE